VGFIDRVVQSVVQDETKPTLWLDSIAHENLPELFTLADSAAGLSLSERLASALVRFPSNARW